MPFPEIERVIYEKNPLVEVICQFRFPRILRIESELPVDFQEKIREQYPIFKELNTMLVQVEMTGASQRPTQSNTKSYEFTSDDGYWKAVLAGDAISLTATNYKRWEEFRDKAEFLFSAFIENYSPKFVERIGLRYRDVIVPSLIDEKTVDWGTVLNPIVAGPFGDNTLISTLVKNTQSQMQIELSGHIGILNAQFGLVENAQTTEIGFLIDGDFFTNERINGDIEDALARCDAFNRKAHQFFRWCITRELHERLEPTAVQ